MKDNINPSHYKSHPSGIECIEISKYLSGCLAQAFQYVWRCGQKDDPIQELKKAIWFIDAELTVIVYQKLDYNSVINTLEDVLIHELKFSKRQLLRDIVLANDCHKSLRIKMLERAKEAITAIIEEYQNASN